MKLAKAAGLVAVIMNSIVLANPELLSDGSTVCGQSPHPMRVSARHIDPKGIGYGQGYTTVEGFIPYSGCQDWVFFLDARAHIFNDGRPAANAGLGGRYLTDKRVWGANVYYDYRKTERQHYNQVAMGFESLGQVWDFRINGYLPVGDHRSSKYHLKFDRFQGHSAILRQKYEYALAGFNAEAGAHVDKWKHFPLYFAVGPYYLHGRGDTTWGGQARASVKIFEYLELAGNVSYDHLYKWIGQGQLSINVRFGGRKQVKKRSNSSSSCDTLMALSERAYQPVDRFEIVPVDHKRTYSTAINPATGKPYYFVFVDNTSSSLGTIESPYPTLAAAQNTNPNSIIYIFPGDGTTKGLDTGIVLSDNQKLWGSGYSHSLRTSLGSVNIRAMEGTKINGIVFSPVITNASGPVVTVANNNEISGLYLQSQGSNPSISATSVANLDISNSTLAGGNAPGYVGINGTELTGTLAISGCSFNQAQNGLLLTNTSGGLKTNINSSTFSNSNDAFAAIQWTLSNGAQGQLTLNNSSIISSGNSVQVNVSDTSGIRAQVGNNQITSAEYGFFVASASGPTTIDVTLQNNNITSYYQSVYLTQTGSLSAKINHNQMFATSEPVIEVDTNTGSTTALVQVTKNNMYSQDNHCVYLNQTAGDVSATVQDNIMTAFDYGTGVQSVLASNAISQTLAVQGNTINAGNNGIYINQAVGSVDATINSNTILTLYDDVSIYLELTGGDSTEVVVNNNIISGYYGIYANQAGVTNFDFTCNNNTGTSEYAYYVDMSAGNTNMSLSGNTFTGYSAVYLGQTGGTLNGTFNKNTFTSAGTGGFVFNSSAGSATMNIANSTITSGGFSGAGGSAISLNITSPSTFNTSITGNTLNGDAFAALVSSTTTAHNMNFSGNTVNSGGGTSFTSAAGDSNWMINGNTFANVGTTPVFVNATGGNLFMQFNKNTAYPTTGAYLLQSSGGAFTLASPKGNIGQLTTVGVTIQP